jgi:hypothetical protein
MLSAQTQGVGGRKWDVGGEGCWDEDRKSRACMLSAQTQALAAGAWRGSGLRR